MNTPEKDERLARRAKALFDESVEELDAATLSRLNRGRHAALAELRPDRAAAHWARWLPATGVAAAAVVVGIMMRGPAAPDVVDAPVTASDFEMLLDEESLEMLEDLEFYNWLEAADLETGGNVG